MDISLAVGATDDPGWAIGEGRDEGCLGGEEPSDVRAGADTVIDVGEALQQARPEAHLTECVDGPQQWQPSMQGAARDGLAYLHPGWPAAIAPAPAQQQRLGRHPGRPPLPAQQQMGRRPSWPKAAQLQQS